MRRILLALLLLLVACQPLTALHVVAQTSTQAPEVAAAPTITPTPGNAFTVIYHPDGALYVGDQISIEVVSPPGFQAEHQSVQISFQGKVLGDEPFKGFGISGRSEATFYWVWDTQNLSPGSYVLDFTTGPGRFAWQDHVTLLPYSELPSNEVGAHWETVTTTCCTINYISGTDAARDIQTLEPLIDEQAADVEKRMGANYPQKVQITLIPRVLGQGGFTSDSIYVSYLDQNYAGSTAAQIIHHELVHALDATMGGDFRPLILVEGLAVYMSDGHFKKEPILPRADILLDLNWYIPLKELSDTFYTSQHEIGYMEAAALVGYLIQTYGWQEYNSFYRDIHPSPTGLASDSLNIAFQKHFHLTLDQVEKNFIAFLRLQTYTAADVTDVKDTVSFYNTVRRYENILDRSAYFLTAWLPDANDMRKRGIVADYLRHPSTPLNQTLEGLLVSADKALLAGNYSETESDIRSVNTVLDLLSPTTV